MNAPYESSDADNAKDHEYASWQYGSYCTSVHGENVSRFPRENRMILRNLYGYTLSRCTDGSSFISFHDV